MVDSFNGTKHANDSSVFKGSPVGCCFLCCEFYPKVKSRGKAFADVRKKVGEGWNNLRHSEKQPYNNVLCWKRIMRCLKHMV